jgi:hypothetical protein
MSKDLLELLSRLFDAAPAPGMMVVCNSPALEPVPSRKKTKKKYQIRKRYFTFPVNHYEKQA